MSPTPPSPSAWTQSGERVICGTSEEIERVTERQFSPRSFQQITVQPHFIHASCLSAFSSLSCSLENSEDARRAYREILVTAPGLRQVCVNRHQSAALIDTVSLLAHFIRSTPSPRSSLFLSSHTSFLSSHPLSPAQYISGAILFEETLYQSTSNGQKMSEVLQGQGIVPGIKVDKGLAALPNSNGVGCCVRIRE